MERNGQRRALGAQRRELGEDGGERFLVVAAHQEVVPEDDQHMKIRLGGEAAEKTRKAGLHLGRVEREQLLELVDDEQQLCIGWQETVDCFDQSSIVGAQQVFEIVRKR